MNDKKRLEEIEKNVLAMSKGFLQFEAMLPNALTAIAKALEDLGYETEVSTNAIFRILIENGLTTPEEIERVKSQCRAAIDQERAERSNGTTPPQE
jgi:hypothetical protein